MARERKHGRGFSVGNNAVQSYPPCRAEDYFSRQNAAKEMHQHIFQTVKTAQFQHQDMHREMRYSGKMPEYDPKCHQMIERWKDQYARRGQSTFVKSKDYVFGG